MKTSILTVCVSALLLMSFTVTDKKPVKNKASVTVAKTASIKWIKEEINIGEIPQGKPVTFEFEFTNTGKEPVLITEVKASCGCTTPDYSKSPVKPGEKGIVKAVYNAGAVGAFNKTVTVITSVDPATPMVLHLSGTVLPAAN